MAKRLIIICGPESSGNRMHWVYILHQIADCQAENGRVHGESCECGHLGSAEQAVLLDRSYPCGKKWPNLVELVQNYQKKGFNNIQIVVLVRSCPILIESQLRKGQVGSELEARQRISKAYTDIFSSINELKLPFVISTYESIIYKPEKYIPKLLKSLGLSIQNPIGDKIYDANERYL